jgi:hypothetical protein
MPTETLNRNSYSVRGTRNGGDKRGNAANRRARKVWFLSPVAGFGGNGETVPCVHCQCELAFADIEADRIIPGGSYRRENVQPSCRPCNIERSDDASWTAPSLASAAS